MAISAMSRSDTAKLPNEVALPALFEGSIAQQAGHMATKPLETLLETLETHHDTHLLRRL